MDNQTSFRLPQLMLRALDRLAKQRGVPKSQLVREALEQYLLSPNSGHEQHAMTVRERSAPYIGSISLSEASANEISVRIRDNNWRE